MNENWLEKALDEAAARGEFDDLRGAGKPIPGLDKGYDPSWWARGFVTRERARDAGITLNADIDRMLPRLLAGSDLDAVRRQVDTWNTEIDRINAAVDTVDRFPLLEMADIEQRWLGLRR